MKTKIQNLEDRSATEEAAADSERRAPVPKYVERAGSLSYCCRKNPQTRPTNLVIPTHEDASPHPPLTSSSTSPTSLTSSATDRNAEKKINETEKQKRRVESEIHPGEMSRKHTGFFISGGQL